MLLKHSSAWKKYHHGEDGNDEKRIFLAQKTRVIFSLFLGVVNLETPQGHMDEKSDICLLVFPIFFRK
jgi:hypothetical protein